MHRHGIPKTDPTGIDPLKFPPGLTCTQGDKCKLID